MAVNLAGNVDWSTLAPPVDGLRCTIVIPARNEAVLLPRALQAIAAQRDVAFAHEVIVLANNCSDDTAAQARNVAAASACPVHVVEVGWPADLANVGRARRALLDVACARLGPAPGAFVASTDADTRVADDWLAATAAAIDAGADAVGGRIVTVETEALPPSTRRLVELDDGYRLWRAHLEAIVDPDPADPWPRHHQHFGASLAVTTRAYLEVGGQPLVPFLEDEALVQALRRRDKSIRHCPQVRVHTSARLDGRAAVGLSWQLREWSNRNATEASPLVVDPAFEASHWAHRCRTRSLWRETAFGLALDNRVAEIVALCEALRLDPAWLRGQLSTRTHFGRLWEAIETLRSRADPAPATMPMDDALRALRRQVHARLA